MAINVFDKSKLPSRHSTVGPDRAPHRSYYYAMGLSKEDIARPFVGVVTTWNEAAPCNIALGRQAQAAKRGVARAGGTPREFTTITVTDGIAMGHEGMKSSLVSREVIADSIELTVRGHCYDGLVGIAGCDKSLPGVMMAMLRLNVPSVFLYGGSILPGRFRGRDVTIMDIFEAVGAHAAGRQVLALIERNLRPRDIVTRRALENAATVVAASGGSTNAGLHLPAMANEIGIDFSLRDVAEIFKRTPYIASLKPGGKYVARDLFEAGGVPIVMKALLDGGFLHGDCMTVTGKTIAENLAKVKWNDQQDVVRVTSNPISPTGGVISLRGNLAPDGAIVKVAGMKNQRFVGPARVFDNEEACFEVVNNR